MVNEVWVIFFLEVVFLMMCNIKPIWIYISCIFALNISHFHNQASHIIYSLSLNFCDPSFLITAPNKKYLENEIWILRLCFSNTTSPRQISSTGMFLIMQNMLLLHNLFTELYYIFQIGFTALYTLWICLSYFTPFMIAKFSKFY